MEKRFWLIITLSIILMAGLLLPACASEPSATSTAPAPATSAPAPATSAPAPTTSAPAPATSAPAPTTSAPATKPVAATTTTTKPAEVKTIKISYSCPKGKSYGAGEEWFGPEFEKRTNGRYKVEVYGASTLVPITAVLDSTRKGVCQIGLTSTAMFAKDFPLAMLTMAGSLGWSGCDVQTMTAATDAWREYSQIPEVAAELNNGFKYIQNMMLSGGHVLAKNKMVRVPADFKGMKVAAPGGTAEIVTGNGGAAVALVVPEMYTNLDKGVIEAAAGVNVTMITDWKLQNICKNFSMANVGNGNMIVLANLDFYNGMSAEDKKIFDELREGAWTVTRDLQYENDSKSTKILEDAKINIYSPTAAETKEWVDADEKWYFPKWKADAMSVGVSAATCDKVLQAWKDIRKKYWLQYKLPGTP